MRFGSLFSGIGGIDLGLERAEMECAWQVEINPYRQAVLARHWPNVRRYEDVRGLEGLEPVDLICGGFPCQDVSVAGERAGLRAERSGLFFEFARIIGELRPKWFLVENVPGLLSSNKGADFQTVLETLAELGYGLAWRILDSQYFRVPQRRRRVFIVGYLGSPCPPEVLFEREGGERDSAEGRKAGEGTADGSEADTIGALQARDWKGVGTQYVGEGKLVLEEDPNTEFGTYCDGPDRIYIPKISPSCERHWAKHGNPEGGHSPLIYTPPDPNRMRETTELPRRLDTPRFAALGDAVTVNVAEWIGRRIVRVDQCLT